MRSRALGIGVLLAAGAAFGDGITGYVEEDFVHADTDLTDNAGNTQKTSSDQFTQRYRLNLDRSFFPLLRLNAGGLFEQVNLWTADGTEESFERTRAGNGFANLLLGGNVLSGAASYNYRTTQDLQVPGRIILDEPSLSLNYRPGELPTFNFRLARTHIWDTAHQQEDLATLLAMMNASWQPVRLLNLQYTVSYSQPDDRLHSTETEQVVQTAHADWTRDLGKGASVAAGLNVNDQRFEVTSSGPNSTLITPQAPIAGLSLVEAFPAVATLDTLTPQPALIDGNTTAASSIDLGTVIRLGGDQNLRDLGVQFADLITKVNTFYLYVDRTLPLDVSRTFHFDAYQSLDNITWQQVALSGTPIFNEVLNRFEITIPATANRYLKIVTLPLDPAVTLDKRYSSILVTELQTLLITPVGVTPWQANTRAVANFSGRTPVVLPGLFADVNGIVSHNTATGQPTLNTWLLTEGLSYTRKLSPVVLLNARVSRQDDDQSFGHEGLFIYTASLAVTPLPTLSHSLIYSGQSIWNQQGFGDSNSLSFYNRLAPYRGIGLLAGGSYSVIQNPGGTVLETGSVLLNGTVQPHPTLTLSGTWGYSQSVTTGGGQPRSVQDTNRVDTGITWNPFP
ncbi:MAG TPA: hypothetical protein VLW85_04360, partial [Myxococcales bacterium]|nr:hypothetical protein [Myxococcales bacterium]